MLLGEKYVGTWRSSMTRVFFWWTRRFSCHFGLVYRQVPVIKETASTGTTMSSQLLQSNQLYCNYDNTAVREDHRCSQQRPSSRHVADFFVYFYDLSSSIFVFRTKVGWSFFRSLRIPLRLREGGLVVMQRASQNSCCIWSRGRD